jgi:hypothetical protein
MGLALFLTLAISPALHKSPYLLLTIGVIVSARCGIGPGGFSTLLGAAMAVYFIMPHVHFLLLSGPEDIVPLLLFCTVGFSITWISHRLRLSWERVLAENETLHRSIAEQRKSEEALWESEERYRLYRVAGATLQAWIRERRPPLNGPKGFLFSQSPTL